MVKRQGTISAFFRPQAPQKDATEPRAARPVRAKDAPVGERGPDSGYTGRAQEREETIA